MTRTTHRGFWIVTGLVLWTVLVLGGCENAETGGDMSTGFEAGRVRNESKTFDYKTLTLDNGLEVITLEDFSCPIVSVQVWYHVGSKNEKAGRTGFAHMFEHMMFKGSDLVGPNDYFRLINKAGGSNNGYTSFDKTVYLQTLPKNQTELALWLEAERMSFLNISAENFTTERNVVLEELRMRANQPYGQLYEKVAGVLFAGSPYAWMPIGTIEDLEAATADELRAFWRNYYVPNNAALIVVGAIRHQEAVKLAKEYFGWIPREAEPPRVVDSEPAQGRPDRIVIDDENAPTPLAGLVWRTVPHGHPDEIALDMAAEILGGGPSSRLYRQLVAEEQSAVQAMATTFNAELDGVFVAGAALAPGSETMDAVLETVGANVERVRAEGITEAELEKARNQMLKYLVTETLTIDNKARKLGEAAVVLGDLERVNTIFDDVRGVTAADVQRAAQRHLSREAATTVIVRQNAKASAVEEAETVEQPATEEGAGFVPGRPGVKRPKGYPRKPPIEKAEGFDTTPKFSRGKLANGLEVMVVENHEVPFVSVMLGFTGGAWTEQHPGTAAMTLEMLTRGTENYSEAELAEELDRYAITLAGAGKMDTSEVYANFTTEQTERGVRLLAEAALRPSFSEEEFEKLREQKLAALAIRAQKPDYLADKTYRKALYGEHPYGRTVEGEPEDVESLTPEDLRLWHRKWFRPDQGTLIFAGDITQEKAMALAKEYFGQWQTELVEVGLILADVENPRETRIVLVDRPGSIQSQIRVGQLGITRRMQPAYFYSRPVSDYFGWSFSGRLNQTIRVDKGLTYAAWGGYTANNLAGEFKVSTFTRTETTAEAVQAVLDVIENLRTVPPSDEELSDSKSNIIGNFVRNRETPQQTAEDLWLIRSQGLRGDYLERLLDTVAATTPEACMNLVDETIEPGRMVIVVVGDAEKIREGLEAIAPVEVIAAQEAETAAAAM